MDNLVYRKKKKQIWFQSMFLPVFLVVVISVIFMSPVLTVVWVCVLSGVMQVRQISLNTWWFASLINLLSCWSPSHPYTLCILTFSGCYMEKARDTFHHVVRWGWGWEYIFPFSLLSSTLIIVLLFLQPQPNLLKPFLQMMNRTTAHWERQKGIMTSLPVGSARWTSLWGTFLFLSSTNGNNAMAASA